jgi:outer membrane protein TolC
MAASFRQISGLLLLFLQLQFPIGMSAQQAPPAAPGILQLTLRQAEQLALKQNPQRIIAQMVVCESDRSSQIARSALLPQASVTGLGAKSQYNVQSIESSSRRAAAGPYQFIQAGPEFSQSILSLPLFRGYQIGREGTREARADEQTTREDAVAAVVEQYLLVLRALAARDFSCHWANKASAGTPLLPSMIRAMEF